MNSDVTKVLKYILRSGTATLVITGLVTLVTGLQTNTIDLNYFGFGVAILALNGLLNLVDYYNREVK